MSNTKYLVQSRQHGEPWRTVHICPTREQAEALADVVAAETIREGGRDYPTFPYVRVTLGGTETYNPRAERKAS